MTEFSRYKCLVVDSRENIKMCKIVKINPHHISEIVEMGHIYFRCPEKLYDEVITFLSGKKIVLTEKVNVYQSRNYQRFELKCNDENFNNFYVDLKTNINKLVMDNGNEYYVLAE